MNTIAFFIGSVIGISLGILGTAAYLLPMLNAAEDDRDDAERRNQNLCTWDMDEAEIDVRLFGASSRSKATKH